MEIRANQEAGWNKGAVEHYSRGGDGRSVTLPGICSVILIGGYSCVVLLLSFCGRKNTQSITVLLGSGTGGRQSIAGLETDLYFCVKSMLLELGVAVLMF